MDPWWGLAIKFWGRVSPSIAYLDPWMPLFCIFSLWRPATSVKMNGYLEKLNRLLVWIFPIDWYVKWPHWTFIYWDMVDRQVLGGVYLRSEKKYFSRFFFRFSGKSTLEKTIPPKKLTVGFRCRVFSGKDLFRSICWRVWTERRSRVQE